MESRIKELESSLSALENDLEQIQARETEAKLSAEKAISEIKHWNNEVEEWKSKSEECEKEIQEWKKRASTATTTISKHNRQINSKDKRPAEREKLDSEFKQKIDSMISEIERTAPNLKALDQYEALKEKERAVTEEFEAARKEEKEIADKFNKVKEERYEKFMAAFNHISSIIDKIYKQLTRSNTHPLGGTAYLNLENEDDPFLHGIKYTAMPPTKRFHDMEQLSGGEKTVAALALLFSIHSFRPSPFFILDEVDAALDNFNVAKVAGFIAKEPVFIRFISRA